MGVSAARYHPVGPLDHGLGRTAWKDMPDPTIMDGTDTILRVEATTICGTDL